MDLRFEPLAMPADEAAVVDFLVANAWPFHGQSRLGPDAAARVCVDSNEIASFWIYEGAVPVGLVRLMDLVDLEIGSPLFDLRIAEGHRGRGIGSRAVVWLTDYLFTTHAELHRIEATTCEDNTAMQSVFARCGYRLEGRFVEAWVNADGTRCDALSYAILRHEHLHTTSAGAS